MPTFSGLNNLKLPKFEALQFVLTMKAIQNGLEKRTSFLVRFPLPKPRKKDQQNEKNKTLSQSHKIEQLNLTDTIQNC